MEGWSAARRVLCVRLDGMGDVLMTMPAIAAVRHALPEAEIVLLASPAGAAVARLIPAIDEVIVYEAPWMKSGAEHAPSADRAMVECLMNGEFDAAIVFTVFSQSALPAAMLCRLAGIPLVLAHVRERSYRLLSNAVEESDTADTMRHEVRRQLDLVAALGWTAPSERMRAAIPEVAQREASQFLAQHALDGDWVLVHPGATASSRRYPTDMLGGALARIAGQGVRVAAVGGQGDREQIDTLLRLCPGLTDLGCELPLITVAALIDRAPVLIANNSGPMHLAVACGTPVVALYAATNPQHTPWLAASHVLAADVHCAPCFKSICPHGTNACLAGVDPEQVAGAALDLLARHALAA